MKLPTKLSTGGLVLPKALITSHGWKPGTEFIIQEREKRILLRPKAAVSPRTWGSIVGCIGYRGPRKSLKEMNRAIAAEARGVR